MQADDFNYIRQLVLDQSALTLEAGKEYLVESRLDPLARQEGFPSYLHMVKSLRSAPVGELHRRVVEAMANNETSFFRDTRAFGMIARSILPALVAERIGFAHAAHLVRRLLDRPGAVQPGHGLARIAAGARGMGCPDYRERHLPERAGARAGPAVTPSSRSTADCRRICS